MITTTGLRSSSSDSTPDWNLLPNELWLHVVASTPTHEQFELMRSLAQTNRNLNNVFSAPVQQKISTWKQPLHEVMTLLSRPVYRDLSENRTRRKSTRKRPPCSKTPSST